MRSRRSRIRTAGAAGGGAWQQWIPVGLFAVMVVLGPLAFGAVDRWAQLALACLLMVGVYFQPIAIAPAGKAKWLALAAVALIVMKEFLPSALFGNTTWRGAATGELGLALSWMHNPEPARALDGLLVLLMAAVWFQWIRTLAVKREQRVVMVWTMALAGAVMAVVCFVAKEKAGAPGMIFGIRETPGWTGWGPFPNRNHTASFLAMGIVLGLGCVGWAFAKRRQPLAVCGIVAVVVMIGALLNGKSRGGLVAMLVGAVTFAGLIVWKRRDRRTLICAAGALVLLGGLVAAFGGAVLERFTSHEAGAVSNNMRVEIWKNAAGMWMDAPVFGHGVESFTQVFPLYQELNLDGQAVRHPESSWLLWLGEMGALPAALVLVAMACVVWPALRAGLEGRGRFYLFAGAMAAAAAWSAHCAIDVPGHRWGTAAFALAALAVACPMREAAGVPARRAVALLPAAVAAFWALPFVGKPPEWSPVIVDVFKQRDAGKRAGGFPTVDECEGVLRYFPLNVSMHQSAGIAQLSEGRRPVDGRWQKHFEVVQRLAPGAWNYLVLQARATMGVSPTLGISYWQEAVERSGRQRAEMVRSGLMETAHLAVALPVWDRFIREHPDLALAYARALMEELRRPRAEARRYFDLWWAQRAAGDVAEAEIRDFNQLSPGWVSAGQLDAWIHRHPARRRQDFRSWVAAFHQLGEDQRAWDIYSAVQAPPGYAGVPVGATREKLEANWKMSHDNPAHARTLAEFYETAGEKALMRDVVLEVAGRGNAPLWFVQKGAHVLAGEGRIHEAVLMALRDK